MKPLFGICINERKRLEFRNDYEPCDVLAPAIAAHEKILEQMEDFRSSIGQLFLNMLIGSLIMPALLAVWMFIGSSRVSKNFVKPIQQLSKGVVEISGGNFDKKLDVKTGDEIEELANSFNTMTDNLKTYMTNLEKVTAAEERIATELKVATNIQLSALTHDFFEGRSDFELYATMHAAKEVGGDFYAVMALANQQLCQGNDETIFITVFLAILDLKTGKLKLRSRIGEMDFVQQETQMNHGDIIYLYTDGITEAMNKNREQSNDITMLAVRLK